VTSPPPREDPAPRVPGLPSTRTAGRRPSLPNGRAVLGGLLVATAAIGTFAAWSGADDEPSTTYVVAARDLPVGRVVTPDDLDLVALDAPPSVAQQAFDSAELVVGQRTVAPLHTGELVQRSAVVVPEGARGGRQVSFAIEAADALAGTLEEGEEVDLLATFGASASTSATQVVAAGAVVARLSEGDGAASGELVVLVTLPPTADVLAVTDAIRQGALTIVRSS
jgi:Flp pilus assembly protein CpaB